MQCERSLERGTKPQFSSLRIHDLPYSAAVNLIEAGVDRDLVMKIGAWKTDAMLTPYNIINTDRMKAAMEKGGQYVASRMKGAR